MSKVDNTSDANKSVSTHDLFASPNIKTYENIESNGLPIDSQFDLAKYNNHSGYIDFTKSNNHTYDRLLHDYNALHLNKYTLTHIFEIVGVFFQSDYIKNLVSAYREGWPVIIYHDRNNVHDKNAIAILIPDKGNLQRVGWIAKTDQCILNNLLNKIYNVRNVNECVYVARFVRVGSGYGKDKVKVGFSTGPGFALAHSVTNDITSRIILDDSAGEYDVGYYE